MALTPASITAALESSRAAGVFPFLGPTFSQIALAIGSSVSAWAVGQSQNVALVGAVTGAAGAGVINAPTTRIIVPPDPASVLAGLTSAGVIGPTASSLASVVAVGISSAFGTVGQYQGVSAGVAAGADASKITVANPATLSAIMVPAFAGIVGPGPTSPQIATGLSLGIATLLLTGTGFGAVTPSPGAPPPSPPPILGVTTSVLV